MANPKITVTGFLGQEPDSFMTKNGEGVRLRLATNDTVKDAQGNFQDINKSWWTVKLFNKQAELAKNLLNKGQLVTITGTIYEDTYQDKEGKTKSTYEIKGDTVSISTLTLSKNTTKSSFSDDIWDGFATEVNA